MVIEPSQLVHQRHSRGLPQPKRCSAKTVSLLTSSPQTHYLFSVSQRIHPTRYDDYINFTLNSLLITPLII